MLGEPAAHFAAVGHGDQGKSDIIHRIGIDEGLPNAALKFFLAPPHSHARCDDRPHGHPANKIDWNLTRPQGPDRADVRIGSRRAARQNQTHGLTRDHSRQPLGVGEAATPELK